MTPSLHRNIVNGQNNYLGMVKEHKIGQSAAKYLYDGDIDKRSTTIPRGSRALQLETVGFSSTSMYISRMKIYTLNCVLTGDIRYIGVTSRSLKERFNGHIYNSRNVVQSSVPVSKWIKSLNQKISINLLDEVDDSYWQLMEQYWISQFKSWGYSLLNLDKGGNGVVKGRRTKTILSKERPVDMFTKDGEYVTTYPSIKVASAWISLRSCSSITNVLAEASDIPMIANSGKNFAGGFRWAYAGEKPSPIISFIVKGERFFSISEASRKHRFCRNKAMQYLKGLRGPIKGLRIKYDIV